MNISAKNVEALIRQLSVLVVDDKPFMRNLVRGMLANIDVKKIFEADDGIAAPEMIRSATPDVVVLDWEMPLLNGPELVRIVRSP
jgi:two-component system chemotaxis response regulator CheY